MNINAAPVYTISGFLQQSQLGGSEEAAPVVAPAVASTGIDNVEYKILKYKTKIQKLLREDPSRAARITDPAVRKILNLN